MSDTIKEVDEVGVFSAVDKFVDIDEDECSDFEASSIIEKSVLKEIPCREVRKVVLEDEERVNNMQDIKTEKCPMQEDTFILNSKNIEIKSTLCYNKNIQAQNTKQEKKRKSQVHIKRKFLDGSVQSISDYLGGVIFSGWIKERQWVENLNSYRDIIEVDEWEEDTNMRIKSIITSILGTKLSNRWINITGPSESCPCYRLWVILKEAPFPGHYWFNIHNITADAEFGLKVNLDIIRRIHEFDGESCNERENRLKVSEISAEEWKEWLSSITSFDMKPLVASVLTTLTPSNIANGFRLLIILSVTLIVALSALLRETWHFILRFMREFGILIHHATPFLQSVIGFFEKMFGGIFLLIAMVYKDVRRPTTTATASNVPQPPLSIAHPHIHRMQDDWAYHKEEQQSKRGWN